ncbi:hypothetical protein ACFVV7_11970 [Streptomyces globisporus]|uniref:hypothetical protein n=1 Tax=Streptomyces globisporus TaxID=1908 RepID=UPI0036D7CB65
MSDHLAITSAPGDDSGCLRRIMAVPLTILYALAAFCCCTALITRPSGSWDQDAYGAIALMSFLALALSALGLLVTVASPTVRRAMGPWWLAPPLVISVVAAMRWALGG